MTEVPEPRDEPQEDASEAIEEKSPLSLGRGIIYIATLAGLALFGRSIWIGPVPLTVSVSAFVIYGAIVICGVVVPQLEMFARLTWRGPKNRAQLALTFDDGPDPQTTPLVLETLKKYRAHATFFLIGYKAQLYPQLVRQILDDGHEIGIHSFTHDVFLSLRKPSVIEDDLRKTRDLLEKIAGVPVVLFRPPVGHVSPRTAEAVKNLGLHLVAWSVRGRDGLASAKPVDVANRVIRGIKPGAIVLMHDASEEGGREPAGVAVLGRILEAIEASGMQTVLVSVFAK